MRFQGEKTAQDTGAIVTVFASMFYLLSLDNYSCITATKPPGTTTEVVTMNILAEPGTFEQNDLMHKLANAVPVPDNSLHFVSDQVTAPNTQKRATPSETHSVFFAVDSISPTASQVVATMVQHIYANASLILPYVFSSIQINAHCDDTGEVR